MEREAKRTMSESVDILISRVVDGAASASDWAALEAAAAAEPTTWRDVAMAQRDHALLSERVGLEIAAADGIELPLDAVRSGGGSVAGRRWASWTGWVAAAGLALYAANGVMNRAPEVSPGGGVVTAGLSPTEMIHRLSTDTSVSADQARDLYLSKGQHEGTVLGEMPTKVLVYGTPTDEGYRVVFVRQIVESARVNDLYRFSRDEAGHRLPVPIAPGMFEAAGYAAPSPSKRLETLKQPL